MENLNESIKEIMSAVLELPIDEINEKTSSETLSSWDSLKHMNLIIALEEEFNVKFSIDQIIEMKSYSSISSGIQASLNL